MHIPGLLPICRASLFPVAALTNYHKRGGFKKLDIGNLTAGGQKSTIKVSAGGPPPDLGEPVPYPFQLFVVAGWGLHHSHLRLCIYTTFSSSVCQISLSLIRTLAFGFRAHPDNPG